MGTIGGLSGCTFNVQNEKKYIYINENCSCHAKKVSQLIDIATTKKIPYKNQKMIPMKIFGGKLIFKYRYKRVTCFTHFSHAYQTFNCVIIKRPKDVQRQIK